MVGTHLGWIGSGRVVFMEARYSQPGIPIVRPELENIFLTALYQRARLRQDQ